MALTKKTIKQKIHTAKSIKKTTKTMEMISAVKMRRLTSRTEGVRLYARYALELIKSIATREELAHPLIKKRESGRTLVVIVGSQKGLCGGYNVQLNKKLRELVADGTLIPEETDAVCIGRYAERIALRAKLTIVASFPGISEITSPEEVRYVFDICSSLFLKDATYRKVSLLHTTFIKPLEYAPTMRRLLPLSQKMAEELAQVHTTTAGVRAMNASLYTLEPSTEAIISQALPQLLLAVLFEAILESLASEHGSRMVAMKNATDNATEMQAELTLWYNKVRQQGITQEIAEISGGAEALSGATLSI